MSMFYCLFIALLAQFCLAASSAQKYIQDWPEKHKAKILIRDPIGQGDYLNHTFTQWIDRSQVSLILEIGSRDAIDALDLSEYYQAPLFAFECNPQAIDICRHNTAGNPNIIVVPMAAWNMTTSLSFFPVVEGGQIVCIGASSAFRFDPAGPVMNSQKQDEIIVPAIRLDEWLEKEKINSVDLICIDAQGATLQVIEGLGDRIANVKYVICEAEYCRYYVGESLYPEIEAYFTQHGFTAVSLINHHNLYADVLFVRNDLISKK